MTSLFGFHVGKEIFALSILRAVCTLTVLSTWIHHIK